MATVASIRVVKQFTYRGVLRNFSNRYHFTGTTPPDSTHWTTLSDAITAAEKQFQLPLASGGAKIIETVGYAAGSEIPVFTKTYALDGTSASSFVAPVPGDVAALVRYSTSDRSSKNHPIYLFNYYHAIPSQSGTSAADVVNTNQKALLGVYAADWVAGFSDGAVTHVRCGPSGHVATGYVVEPNLTHRDLPR